MDRMNDRCEPVTVTGVDGEPVMASVHGGAESWTSADVDAFGEIVRAAQRKHRREHPELYAVETEDAMPERIQQRRTKGWRLPTNARSVARPSYFGNPYRIGDVYLVGPLLPFPLPSARTWEGPAGAADLTARRCPDAATAVAWFRQWAVLALEPSKVELLRGMHLACWCPPDQPCHADVLLEMANRPLPTGSEET